MVEKRNYGYSFRSKKTKKTIGGYMKKNECKQTEKHEEK